MNYVFMGACLAWTGDYDTAVQYLVKRGGIAPGKGYEYLGQDGFCRDSNYSDALVRVKVGSRFDILSNMHHFEWKRAHWNIYRVLPQSLFCWHAVS